MNVMVAAGSQLAADGGAAVAARGGNAVDAALAAMFISMATEPGIVGPGAGGFIAVWAEGEDPVVIDAYVEMPGRGLEPEELHQGLTRVWLDYGGGVSTYVGYGSVGTPGGIAGMEEAWERFGSVAWKELLAPTIAATRAGFPLPIAAAQYLEAARDLVYGWDPGSYEALHVGGRPIEATELVRIPKLVESLEVLAAGGAAEMYTGSIADQIVAGMKQHGGIVTATDLAVYAPIARQPIVIQHDEWTIATNPAPAVGGATLAALTLVAPYHVGSLSQEWVDAYAAAQRDVFEFRLARMGAADDRVVAAAKLLAAARTGDLATLGGSPSTTHASAVDTQGTACAVTMSAGYGSGAMPAGMWMNNSLGEIELAGQDPHAVPPGTRMVSNMAPTVARHSDGSVLAIGSPGADRITTAIATTLLRFTEGEMTLQQAVDAPRIHVEVGDEVSASAEPGLEPTVMGVNRYPRHSMYFGGVQAASWHPDRGFEGAADPRRTGGIALG